MATLQEAEQQISQAERDIVSQREEIIGAKLAVGTAIRPQALTRKELQLSTRLGRARYRKEIAAAEKERKETQKEILAAETAFEIAAKPIQQQLIQAKKEISIAKEEQKAYDAAKRATGYSDLTKFTWLQYASQKELKYYQQLTGGSSRERKSLLSDLARQVGEADRAAKEAAEKAAAAIEVPEVKLTEIKAEKIETPIFKPITVTDKKKEIPSRFTYAGGYVGEPTTKIIYEDIEGGYPTISYQQKGKEIAPEIKITSLGEDLQKKIDEGGKGAFTSAVDFGRGVFQDVIISYDKGKITDVSRPSTFLQLGKPDPREVAQRVKGEIILGESFGPVPLYYQQGKVSKQLFEVEAKKIETPTLKAAIEKGYITYELLGEASGALVKGRTESAASFKARKTSLGKSIVSTFPERKVHPGLIAEEIKESPRFPKVREPSFVGPLTLAEQFIRTGATELERGGVLFITPEVAAKRKPTTEPVYVITSDVRTPAGQERLKRELAFAKAIKPSTKKVIFGKQLSRGQFEFNIQQIKNVQEAFKLQEDVLTSQEALKKSIETQKQIFIESPESFVGRKGVITKQIEGGKEFTLTEEYFKGLPEFKTLEISTGKLKASITEEGFFKVDEKKSLAFAKAQFKALPAGVQSKSQLAEADIGLRQAAQPLKKLSIQLFTGIRQASFVQDPKTGKIKEIGRPEKVLLKKDEDILFVPTVKAQKSFLESPTGFIKEAILERPAAVVKTGVGLQLVTGAVRGIVSGVRLTKAIAPEASKLQRVGLTISQSVRGLAPLGTGQIGAFTIAPIVGEKFKGKSILYQQKFKGGVIDQTLVARKEVTGPLGKKFGVGVVGQQRLKQVGVGKFKTVGFGATTTFQEGTINIPTLRGLQRFPVTLETQTVLLPIGQLAKAGRIISQQPTGRTTAVIGRGAIGLVTGGPVSQRLLTPSGKPLLSGIVSPKLTTIRTGSTASRPFTKAGEFFFTAGTRQPTVTRISSEGFFKVAKVEPIFTGRGRAVSLDISAPKVVETIKFGGIRGSLLFGSTKARIGNIGQAFATTTTKIPGFPTTQRGVLDIATAGTLISGRTVFTPRLDFLPLVDVRARQRQREALLLATPQEIKLEEVSRQIQFPKVIQEVEQGQVTEGTQITEVIPTTPVVPPIVTPTIPIVPRGPQPPWIEFPLIDEGKPKKKVLLARPLKEEPGFNTLIKNPATKKYIKVNKVPISKSHALDLGSEIIDKTKGTTWRIKSTGKLAQLPKRKIVPGYYKQTKHKYHKDIDIIKGQEKKRKNTFSEKLRFRNDTLGEINNLPVTSMTNGLRFSPTEEIKKKKKIPGPLGLFGIANNKKTKILGNLFRIGKAKQTKPKERGKIKFL